MSMTTPNIAPSTIYQLIVSYFINEIGDRRQLKETVSVHKSPMDAMLALSTDTKDDGGFTWHQATCYRVVNCARQERQFLITID